MSVSANHRNYTGCPVIETNAQFMPDEVQKNICRFISVRNGRDISALLMLNSVFHKSLNNRKQLAEISDEVKTAGKIGFSALKTAFQKHLSTLPDLKPELRIQTFHLLSTLAGAIASFERKEACYQLLWEQVGSLPASSRSEAMLKMTSCQDAIPYDRVIALLDDLPHAHQPEILGLISERLMMCSNREFAALLNTLLNKAASLSDEGLCNALACIHERTVASWQAQPDIAYDPEQSTEPPPFQFMQKERCMQIIEAARQRIATLPPKFRNVLTSLWK